MSAKLETMAKQWAVLLSVPIALVTTLVGEIPLAVSWWRVSRRARS